MLKLSLFLSILLSATCYGAEFSCFPMEKLMSGDKITLTKDVSTYERQKDGSLLKKVFEVGSKGVLVGKDKLYVRFHDNRKTSLGSLKDSCNFKIQGIENITHCNSFSKHNGASKKYHAFDYRPRLGDLIVVKKPLTISSRPHRKGVKIVKNSTIIQEGSTGIIEYLREGSAPFFSGMVQIGTKKCGYVNLTSTHFFRGFVEQVIHEK